MAFAFGVFQGGMPLLGWILGNRIVDVPNKEIIALAVATSIDALAVGISFAFLNVSIVPAALTICLITFIMCLIGVFGGNKVGDIFNGYAELLGGIVLILIGFSIFNEHTQIIKNIF